MDFIAQEHLAGLPGRLGMTIALGKKDPSGLNAAWDRDLDADLLRLLDEYGTNFIVSLIEDHELDLLKIPDLHERALALGVATLRDPIRDGDVPTNVDQHVQVVNAVLVWIRLGKSCVAQCKGGYSRTGLVVATIPGAFGRTVRADTVEVPAQQRWGARRVDVVAARHDGESTRTRRDRPRPAPRGQR